MRNKRLWRRLELANRKAIATAPPFVVVDSESSSIVFRGRPYTQEEFGSLHPRTLIVIAGYDPEVDEWFAGRQIVTLQEKGRYERK